MRKPNKSPQNTAQRGNAMIYILIALGLFGFLTVTMSRQNQQADGRNLSKENIVLYTNNLIEYTTAAQQVITMMLTSGSQISDLDFTSPSDATFNTPSFIHKIFHPRGGGLNYIPRPDEDMMADITGNAGWQFQTQINVEWTKSTDEEIILTAHKIKRDLCENINLKITGNTTIPTLTTPIEDHFVEGIADTDFTTTQCPDCEGYVALCVENAAQDSYAFYTILAAQ